MIGVMLAKLESYMRRETSFSAWHCHTNVVAFLAAASHSPGLTHTNRQT